VRIFVITRGCFNPAKVIKFFARGFVFSPFVVWPEKNARLRSFHGGGGETHVAGVVL